MGKDLFDDYSVYFEPVTDQAYPKVLDVDVRSMKKKSLQFLAVVFVCGILLTVISYTNADKSVDTVMYSISRYLGICTIITAAVYGYFLYRNINRAVNRIMIDQNAIYINNDQFVNDGTLKVTISTFLPIGGLADNVYMKVRSSAGTRKYWFGVKGDEKADAARAAVKNALSVLYPEIRLS